MAQPIVMEIPPRDPKRELLTRLEAAPAEHAAALLDSYELLQTLHESGLLALARGAVGAGTKIIDVASDVANTPESIRAIRNAMLLSKILGAIDPELLARVANAAEETFGSAKSLPQQPPGFFAALRMLAGSEMRSTIAWATAFMSRVIRLR
ncbi:MAG TPA: hypothetical protein VL346_13415 [Acidobacteriaceae bacterium]|jgi:uncharacterized protein YjgD (DUF1641 family)|nr:hypothetical protein [Acidobacteriaceae bacterium]